jgi:two-component system sensor kinase FixL
MDISIDQEPTVKLNLPQEVTGEIMDYLPNFVLLANHTGEIYYANKAAVELFGNDGSMIIQKSAGELFEVNLAGPQANQIWTSLESAGNWSGEIMISLPDGKEAVAELNAIRIDNGSKPIYLYFGQDVTAQRYRQRESCQFEKFAARGEMAGEISHELNNYLSIIMGNLELLGMGLAKGNIDSLAPRIKSMRDGLTRITKFVEGLMSIARPDAKCKLIDLRQYIEKEVFFLRQNPQYQGIEFVFRWDDNVPPVETIDFRLQQALVNIFSNACDAVADLPTGQKRITIEAAYLTATDQVRISISDNGRGMSDENYQKLFRHFFTTKGPGHGFGLLAVKGGIKSQGGKVSAAPSADGGVCFTFELPRQSVSPISRTAKVPA